MMGNLFGVALCGYVLCSLMNNDANWNESFIDEVCDKWKK